jgi:cyclopropane fatty-acyl-phospholipid synthase-like methyltransferase
MAAAPYRSAGRFAFHFAQGKLSFDPVFTAISALGLIPAGARILDLGCGQGLLTAWLLAARTCHQAGDWCDDWPAPRELTSVHGVELKPQNVARARRALGRQMRIELGDIRSAPFADSDAIVIIDVLHYIDLASQEAVLRRVRAAISPMGVLLLRIGDADGGLRFEISRRVDQTVPLLRGAGWTQLHCRSVTDWSDLLHRQGFRVESLTQGGAAAFANVLLVAHPQ